MSLKDKLVKAGLTVTAEEYPSQDKEWLEDIAATVAKAIKGKVETVEETMDGWRAIVVRGNSGDPDFLRIDVDEAISIQDGDLMHEMEENTLRGIARANNIEAYLTEKDG